MIDEHLAVPFDTSVLGMTVTVAKVDLTVHHGIVAICRRDGQNRRSRSSTWRSQRPLPTARNGSRPTAAGTLKPPG